jgi:biopolymer transport protein ExbB/TolQ
LRTILLRTLAFAAVTGFAGTAAAQPEPGYTVVPAAERLTVGGVFADASVEVQIMLALLIAGAVAALAVWATSFGKTSDARRAATALGRLRIVRSGAAPLGFLTASYVLFAGFIGISNVRPTPSLTVLAPGFAEATLAVMLGLLASAVAVICERHLEARIRRAAA